MSTKPHRQTIGKQLIIETHVDEVKIIRFWSDSRQQKKWKLIFDNLALVAFFAFFALIFLSVINASLSTISGGRTASLISLVVPIITLVIALYTQAAYLFNATVISVNKHSFILKHSPIPWLGHKQFSLAELKQLYSQEKSDADKREEFTLYLTTLDLKPYKLLNNLSVEQAQAVTEAVEQVVVGHGQQMIPYIRQDVKGVKGVTVEVSEKRLQIISRWRRIDTLGDGCMLMAGFVLGGCFLIFLIVSFLEGKLSNWIVDRFVRADSWFEVLSDIAWLGSGGVFLIIVGICCSIGLYGLVAQYFNKSRVQIDPNTFIVKNGPIPFIKSKQFDPTDIKQLYSKQRKIYFTIVTDDQYTYDLYLISQNNHHHKLLTLPYLEQVNYLEQTIEEYLGLASQSVTKEAGTGSLGQQQLVFDTWQQLAETHQLEFSSRVNWGTLYGIYRGHRLNLEGFQGVDGSIATRLKVTASQTSTSIEPLSSNGLATLFLIDRFISTIDDQLQVEDNGKTLTHIQERRVTEPNKYKYLQSMFDNLCDLLEAIPSVIATGGQAAPTLLTIAGEKAHLLHAVSIYLLVEIVEDTTHRLKSNVEQLVCPNCLTYCVAYPIQNRALKIDPYYGCRNCRQSREFLEITGQIVIVLDCEMTADTVRHGDNLRVNWLTQRQVGDFARIEIIQATDEEVERFVVQVANDTDPVRQPHYRTMPCVVAPECSLSENTLRILRRTFVVEGEKS